MIYGSFKPAWKTESTCDVKKKFDYGFWPKKWKKFFSIFSKNWELISIKGVVAVPVETACDKATGQNKRPLKPRARFRNLRFFKVSLAAPQNHFLKISWQCNSSPDDQILIKLSPKWLDCAWKGRPILRFSLRLSDLKAVTLLWGEKIHLLPL